MLFPKRYFYQLFSRRKLASVGFTLTESIVLVVIIGIFASLSTPSFLGWLNQRRVDDALAKIEGAIKETQREAIKRSTDCTVNIPRGVDQSITGSCLVTGNRQIEGITINHNKTTINPWVITFDFKGRNRDPGSAGTLWLNILNSAVKPKCMTVSVGIGLMRTGLYDGTASVKCKAP